MITDPIFEIGNLVDGYSFYIISHLSILFLLTDGVQLVSRVSVLFQFSVAVEKSQTNHRRVCLYFFYVTTKTTD
jgi:hypothetical protein